MSKGSILITGASSGLGAEMARQFAALGYDLAVTARRVERLEALRAEITSAHPGARVEVAALDVTDADALMRVFAVLDARLGGLDRVVVNAGLGKGAAIGTGRFDANRETIMTNVVGALAQMEAAMALFRERGAGHLVVISSMSALRGMRRAMTAYAASKAAAAALAEGLQHENVAGVDVSIIYPGYIRSEMNEHVTQKTRFMVDTTTGVTAMVEAIEKRVAKAYVPAWPWRAIGPVMKHAPLAVVRRIV